MQESYQGIRQILTETNELHGWDIPDYVVDYEARLLAKYTRLPDWPPKPSYAERYMTLRTKKDILGFGNDCWFTRSVFPELHKDILGPRYYTDLGKSCYASLLADDPSPTLRAMCHHFEFLAETAYTAIRHYGGFRSMWD